MLRTFLLCTFLTATAQASLHSMFGMGGATSGRVSGVTAEENNGYAALFNPALLSSTNEPIFSLATLATFPEFGTLKGIRKEGRAGRRETPPGDYRPSTANLASWTVGLAYPFQISRDRHAGLGLAVSGPFHRLRSFAAGTPEDFYLLRYGTSDAQFKASFAGSLEILPAQLHLGAGLSVYISGAGSAEATLVSQNPTGRMALEVGLNTAAILGLYSKWDTTAMSLVFHQQIQPSYEQSISGTVQIGDSEVLQQPMRVQTTLYYEPQSLETDLQHDFGLIKASVGVAYQFWQGYRPSFLIAETKDATGATRTTQNPGVGLRNTLNPRVSLEAPMFGRQAAVSIGYQFRPTPITDLSGETNILDSDAHILGASFSHQLAANALIPVPLTWSLFAQYHLLNARQVAKSSRDSLGAPGYDFSGRAFLLGILLQTGL